LITRHGPLHALPKRRRRILPIHPHVSPLHRTFLTICPIKSCSPPHSRRRASSISDMAGATRSRSYTPNSTMGVEASWRQGRPLVPTSPPVADIIVAPPVVEHHSTHQRRDRQGRFSRTSNARSRRRTTTNWSCRQAAEELAVPLVPRP